MIRVNFKFSTVFQADDYPVAQPSSLFFDALDLVISETLNPSKGRAQYIDFRKKDSLVCEYHLKPPDEKRGKTSRQRYPYGSRQSEALKSPKVLLIWIQEISTFEFFKKFIYFHNHTPIVLK